MFYLCHVSDDGISIPCEYNSYLVPIQSEKLHNEVKTCKEKDKPLEVEHGFPFV